MPPLAWDCLTYHLTFATVWLKKGTLMLFKAPDQIAYAGLFPINGEIFASWLILPYYNDLLVNIMNFPISFLGGVSSYAIARELGLTRKEASFVPALICFAPVIYSQITTEYLDIATFTFCCASVLFTLRYLRTGYLNDYILALVAAGLLLGLKYNGIPAVGLIFIATSVKTIRLTAHTGFIKKMSLIFLGIIIVGILGGRQYLLNAIEAGNPLYPFPVKIANQEVFQGSLYLEDVKDWISEFERKEQWDKFSLWEKEYRKFCYLSMAAGPKFFLFLIIAGISLFIRPHHLSKEIWYFVSAMWIIPVVLFYANTSTDFARRAYWIDGSFRFLSPFIALYTIQSLVFIKHKVGRYAKGIDVVFIAFIAWDILTINKSHFWEIAALYPLIIVTIVLFIVLLNLGLLKSRPGVAQGGNLLVSPRASQQGVITSQRWIMTVVVIIILFGGLYFLQCYRDTTRYGYYRGHLDLHTFPRKFVDAWEFLDQPGEKRRIAMTTGWNPPSHMWFFYPLFGRLLQNDIAYISAKYNWDVPTWLHRGSLRGNDFSIWLFNLKREKIDYILVQKPWPIELQWIDRERKLFQLVFSNRDCKIFKYNKDM
jgi:hypothetical protein